MADTNFFRVKNGLNIKPAAGAAPTEEGSITADSTAHKTKIHNGTTASAVVTEDHAQDVLNKTHITVDNLDLNGNTISSTDTNGNIVLTPNGSGKVIVPVAGIDVAAAGNLPIGATVGANTITLGGATSTVQVAGDLKIAGKTIEQAVTTDYYGSELAAGNMQLGSTTHATKGKIILGEAGTSAYDETNDRLGIGENAPDFKLDVAGDVRIQAANALKFAGTGAGDADVSLSRTGTDTLTLASGDTLVADNITVNTALKADAGIVEKQISTPSAPASGYTTVYAKTDGIYYIANGGSETKLSSGSASGINFIANGDAEVNTTGWATYADAAGTAPVNGTGGSPTVTFTRTATTPLRGTGSFLFTKDAADRRGEGASYDFSCAKIDQGKVITIAFDYEIASGTYADNDIGVWIYDTTNLTLIQPAPYNLLNVGVPTNFKATFQTASNSVAYRLIFHCASTSSAAYTVKIDDVVVGPQAIQYGAPVTDWTAYTPAMANVGNATATGFWRQVGDSIQANINILIGSTLPTSNILVSLPSGLVIDTSKANGSAYGKASYQTLGGGVYGGTVQYGYNLPWQVRFIGDNNNYLWSGTVPVTMVEGEAISAIITAPIVGWSSSIVMSSDADTRVVAMNAVKTSGNHTSTGNFQDVAWDSGYTDTHGAFDGTTYTVKVPGWHDIAARVGVVYHATGTRNVAILVNGSIVTYGNTSTPINPYVTAPQAFYSANLKAGDTIKIQATQDSGGNLAYNGGTLSISRKSGPAQIAASESVNLRYTSTSTSVTTSTPTVVVSTKDYDSHLSYNNSTGTFVAPTAGKYAIGFMIRSPSQAWTAGQLIELYYSKNGGGNITFGRTDCWASVTTYLLARGYDEVNMNAGDTIVVKAYSSNTITPDTATLTIHRIGN